MFETLRQYGLSDIHLMRDAGCGLQAIIAINAGGLIYASMRYAGEQQAAIDEKLRGIAVTIRQLLADSAVQPEQTQSPLQAALLLAKQRIAGGQNTTANPDTFFQAQSAGHC